MTVRLIVVGSANVDLVWNGPRLPSPGETVSDGTFAQHFGGKGANQACAAAKLGAAVALVATVGKDNYGQEIRRDLQATGIDCRYIVDAPDPIATGIALITVDTSGENSIAVAPGANRTLNAAHITTAIRELAREGYEAILVGFEIGIEAARIAVRTARDVGLRTHCNPSPVDARAVDSVFPWCDTVVVNQLECDNYNGVATISNAGCSNVVVTLGAQGAQSHIGDAVSREPAFRVAAVDTTGAGDAFCAALAVTTNLRLATAAGALACTAFGARGWQPTLDEIHRFVAEAGPRVGFNC